ncbi:MAG: carbonic anhydrase [Desulfosporosinus sp.]
MAHGAFGTAINCMDGRTQLPVNEYLKNRFKLDFIDTITEPGPVKILAENLAGVASIEQRVKISVEAHGSKLISVVAHHDCAGNPAPKETQLKQLEAALQTVRAWNYQVQCIGLWVDEKWQVVPVE